MSAHFPLRCRFCPIAPARARLCFASRCYAGQAWNFGMTTRPYSLPCHRLIAFNVARLAARLIGRRRLQFAAGAAIAVMSTLAFAHETWLPLAAREPRPGLL